MKYGEAAEEGLPTLGVVSQIVGVGFRTSLDACATA